MAKLFRSKLVVCTSPANPQFTTSNLFDTLHVESVSSPIDQFMLRLHAINKLAPPPSLFDPLQAQLVLLGVVAAVESYYRTLLRRLISIDPDSQNCTEDKEVTYGAAMHLPKTMMPEAMLERVTFIGEKNIVDALREFVGVKGNLPPELVATIADYTRVCQLRHCAVHRFGKLGVKNAISLGLREHRPSLEKPLILNYQALQAAIAIATGVVKTTNNFLFNEVLSRIPSNSWAGSFTKDKRIFLPYYELFADTVSTSASGTSKQLYATFAAQRAKFAAGDSF